MSTAKAIIVGASIIAIGVTGGLVIVAEKDQQLRRCEAMWNAVSTARPSLKIWNALHYPQGNEEKRVIASIEQMFGVTLEECWR